MPKLLNVHGLAAATGLSRWTIYKLCQGRRLRPINIARSDGRPTWRFDLGESLAQLRTTKPSSRRKRTSR